MRILLAQDEGDPARALGAFLEKNRFSVDTVHNGEDAYEYARSGNYDAAILDVMTPELDGVQALKRLREDGVSIPVMLLTAKGEAEDRIAGFDAGADDYLSKPFRPDELLSRLRAMLRRGGEYRPDVLAFADLTLDCGCGELRCAGRAERLSAREFQIMELFLRSPRVILPAGRILERVWGWNAEAEINVVWVHISNLRRKLNALGSRCALRATRGLGYSLEEGP